MKPNKSESETLYPTAVKEMYKTVSIVTNREGQNGPPQDHSLQRLM